MAFVGIFESGFVICSLGKLEIFKWLNGDEEDVNKSCHFKTIDLNVDYVKEEDGLENDKNDTKMSAKDGQVLCCRFSQKRNRFAVATNWKRCFIFDVSSAWRKVTEFSLPKAPTALEFSEDSQSILVADRAGCVIKYPVENCFNVTDAQQHSAVEKKIGQLLLGHLSIVLDLQLTGDGKFLLTCDRDEKIRISHYPDTYCIQSFCLGHIQYVKSLAVLDAVVISGGGDGQIIFWTFDGTNCLKVQRDDAELSVHKIVVCCTSDDKVSDATLGVIFEASPHVRLIGVKVPKNEDIYIVSNDLITANGILWDIDCTTKSTFAQFLILTKNGPDPLQIINKRTEDGAFAARTVEVAQSDNRHLLRDDFLSGARTDLPVLTKVTKFNNWDQYLERKLERMSRKKRTRVK